MEMPTNLDLDDDLLDEALKVGGLGTKKATVNEALREFIRRRAKLKMIESFGTIDFHEDFDRKYQPRKKRKAR
jgi:Arc/MetJ family transcription regulator